MGRVEEGQLRKWVDEGFPDDSLNMFFVVSVSSYSGNSNVRDIAKIISCSKGFEEHILKISVDYVERNSVIVA